MENFNDSQDPYEHIKEGNAETKSNGRRKQITPPYLVETMEISNEIFIKVEEENNQINASILQSLKDIQ